MNHLTIRPADSGDAPALAVLIGAFRDHLGATVPTDADVRTHLPRVLADPGKEFSCAWVDGEAVGYTQTRFFASLWVGGTEAHLDDLFVVLRARGQGVGRALLRHALARARARGALQFGLNTNERNEAAQSLYRSEGLSPQSHALYPGGREVFWVRKLEAKGESPMDIEGGCYCGALRYQAKGDSLFKGQCHCRECQYISGGHPNVVIGMSETGFAYTKGSPKTFRRSDIENPVTREFCPGCGTHILTKAPGVPGAVLIKVGTLDDPSAFGGPEMVIFTVDKQSFHHVPAGVPAFERLPS